MNQQPTNTTATELENLKGYLLDYLQTKSYYNPNRKYANKIICLNPNRHDTRPSMSYNRKNNTLHCFSCGVTYSIIDLVIIDYELGDQSKPLEARLKDKATIGEACKIIKELFNINGDAPRPKNYSAPEQPKEDIKALFNTGVLGQPTRAYLESRGLTDEALIGKLGLKNRYDKNNTCYLMIPYNLSGELEHFCERVIGLNNSSDLSSLPKEMRYKHHGTMAPYDPFNFLTANTKRAIFITEGEIDTISIYQTLKELKNDNRLPLNTGSIALGGINNDKAFINMIPNMPNKDELYFILALDNDERGQKKQQILRGVMEDNNLNYCIFTYDTFKDANEYLMNQNKAFKLSIYETLVNIQERVKNAHKEYIEALNEEFKADREKYINDNSMIGYINTFNKHRLNPTPPVRTYFSELDYVLNRGFKEGLITIGAVSSLGKTSFILQLADQIAQSRQKDVYYFSLEMSRDELIAKSLNRLMFLKSNNNENLVKSQAQIQFTDFNNWETESQKLFNISLEAYKSYAPHLFIKEGVNNFGVKEIEETIREYHSKTNQYPVIIIDYLQILASTDPRLSDKQKLDQNILDLKQLSRDINTPIIVVSSLNRASYSQDVSLASFKESGAIEYTSDVILGLNYNLTDDELQKLKEVRRNSQGLPEEEKAKAIEDFYKQVRAKNPRNIKLTVLKNRQGAKDKDILFYFYPNLNLFKEVNQDMNLFKELIDHSIRTKGEERIETPF